MKVRALKLFNDLQDKKLRKEYDVFEVTQKRASEINTSPHGVLIEVIEEIVPVKKKTTKKVGE